MDQKTSAEARVICKIENGYLDVKLRIPGKVCLIIVAATLVYFLPDLARVLQAVTPLLKP